MQIYRSNRVERLFDALVQVVEQPLPDPLQPECIVVSSRGMNTWLSMQLANRMGVWAGGRFPFPRRFVDDLFAAFHAAEPAWRDPQQLLWPVLAELPRHLTTPPFAELARFVAADATGRHLFQLAEQIAATFDQYPVFRPDLVLGWDSGRDDHWQAVLWRAVIGRLGTTHVAAQARDFVTALRSGESNVDLPARVCVFGVSTLPPFYLHALEALDRVTEVHLFIVSPSQNFWAEGDLDTIPPLLVSLGAVGREFQGMLEQFHYRESAHTLYADPGRATVLAATQSRLLHLDAGAPIHPIDPSDRSVLLHACHSPMREVDVLHDQILDMLRQDASLQPRDIVVLMSDVDTYAPLIEAVFERDESDPNWVPYSIADRSPRADNPILEAFHRVVRLVGGRACASEVLDLLTLEPIQDMFGIGPEQLDTLGAWVEGAGIRWGIDAEHRMAQGQPKMTENTWRFGLDRLFLGFAMPGEDRSTFAGVLPYDEIEGSAAELLGRFAEFCDVLFGWLRELAAPRSPRRWQEGLAAMLETLLVAADSSRWDSRPLQQALDTIACEAEASRFEDPIQLESMLQLLDARLERDAAPVGFLTRGVTFCAMLPMRSVPFAVVCMIGLSDGAFPRGTRRVGFDLITADPRPGDRSRRADDRYLFLEALLAARARVHLSYVGQSIQDNSDRPPSVVVSELFEQLGATLQPPAPLPATPEGVQACLRVRHPMQPFSPRYFRGHDRLFSYSAEYCEGAQALVGAAETRVRPPLLTEPLEDPRGGRVAEAQLDLDRLVQFYRLPIADLVKRRLGVFLGDNRRDSSNREPMELTGLARWQLGDTVLQHGLANLPAEVSRELARAAGHLPLGMPGVCTHAGILRATRPLLDHAAALREASPLPGLQLDLALGSTRLVGTIGARWPIGRSVVRFSKLSPKHRLEAWIRHLCVCASDPSDQRLQTVVLGRGEDAGGPAVERCEFGPVIRPLDALADLVELFWIGQREPLLLFPTASFAYAEAYAQTADPQAAMGAARREWHNRSNFEREDPHLRRLAFDADVLQPGYSPLRSPLGAGDFATVAVRVFGPLVEAAR